MKTRILIFTLLSMLFVGNTAVYAEQGITMLPSDSLEGEKTGFSQHFTDVPPTHWAFETIEWGYSNKIASGYGDGKFKPSMPVTQEEFLALLIRAYKGEVLTAASNEKWSEPYYKIALANNYPVSGARDSKITRQSVAEIIVGVEGKNYLGKDAVQYLLGNKLAQGKDGTTSISGFAADDKLSRAEAIQFIRNVLTKSETKTLLVRPSSASPKNRLPELPLSPVMAIGKYNKELEAIANKINPVAAESGYCAFYNGDTNAVGVTFCVEGEIAKGIMTYSLNDHPNADYVARVSFTFMLLFKDKNDGSGESDAYINDDRFNVAVSALKAMGIVLNKSDIEKIKEYYVNPKYGVGGSIDTVINGKPSELAKPSMTGIAWYIKK